MITNKYAIIDIGSNSVRFAEECDRGLPRKEVYTTRLGSGIAAEGRLAEGSMRRSLEIIGKLARRAEKDGFIVRGYATSAVRDAENGREFAELIEKTCGVPVEILSGEEEARYAFIGASEGRKFDTMLDIGGASMQIVRSDFAVSFPAGCVRCADIARANAGTVGGDGLSAQREAVRRYLEGIIRLPEFETGRLVGVGGTNTSLAALKAGLTVFSAETVESTELTSDELGELIERLVEMGEKRREHPLLKERHDVILYGAYILSFALEALGAKRMFFSTRDGMEGYLHKVKNEGK